MIFFTFVAVLASVTRVRAETEAEKTAPVSPDWDSLASTLGDAFQFSQVDEWFDQCVKPFDLSPSDPAVSNYQLFEQSSGLCMAHVDCNYESCHGPFSNIPTPVDRFNSTEYPRDSFESYEGLDLPTAVVHPKTVADISETFKFANKHKVGVSVKTSGHSYTGSSTKKGTVLLNLSKLKKYSPNGSIIECEKTGIPEGAYEQACKLALARNKPAVVRVGGGEIWDETLRAVSQDWNSKAGNTKYHIVSGAAGTVSAAGGWLASGGLSGNNGMRLYGIGIDQVLHVEMVLPSGKHVRFGPTNWKEEEGKMYHVTTEVSGLCNKGELSDESLWDWQGCDEDINFGDLWYAVRGGGGGTFGVVSSVYYQLHEFSPMELTYISFVDAIKAVSDAAEFSVHFSKLIEFVMRFLFLPESVGVTEIESSYCNAPATGGFVGQLFICFKGGSLIMKEAWASFYGNEIANMLNVTVDDYFIIRTDITTWAEAQVVVGLSEANVPDGRAADTPPPAVTNSFLSKSFVPSEQLVFPSAAITEENVDKLSYLILNGVLAFQTPGTMYIKGGMIPAADDGMNSLSIGRRNAAFTMNVIDYDLRHKFQQVFYGVSETGEPFVGDNLPGVLCHNHASIDYPTPLKSDWTKMCNPEWPAEKKAKECYTFQEAAFGEEGVKKLEKIHSAVDPNHILNCLDGVGYAEEIDEEEDGDSSDTASADVETSDANVIDFSLAGLSIFTMSLFLSLL